MFETPKWSDLRCLDGIYSFVYLQTNPRSFCLVNKIQYNQIFYPSVVVLFLNLTQTLASHQIYNPKSAKKYSILTRNLCWHDRNLRHVLLVTYSWGKTKVITWVPLPKKKAFWHMFGPREATLFPLYSLRQFLG